MTAMKVVAIAALAAGVLIWLSNYAARRHRPGSDSGLMVVTSTYGGRKAPPVVLKTVADLKLLKPTHDEAQLLWPRRTIPIFGRTVAAFLPGDFEAYVRIFNPFRLNVDPPVLRKWSELAAAEGLAIDETGSEDFAMHGIENAQALVGELDESLVIPLIEHLTPATSTPSRVFFAAWEGYGGTIARQSNGAVLDLPDRKYYVFEGPVEGARDSFSSVPWSYQSANMWWPQDHAWFVSMEVDAAWTYVGGTRKLIDALVHDPRFDLVEVSARDRW